MAKNYFKSMVHLVCLLGAQQSLAVAMDFTGTYRFEWTEVDRPSLATPHERKAYGLNYLGLDGKIIASDGINIHTRLDVLPNTDPAYQNTQFGQQWGSGNSNTSTTNVANSNATSKAPDSQYLKVSQLYLNVNQEYGSLVIGRAPFHFGLGINYNSGQGPFDHYATVMDMVSFKFLIDNVKYMPMIARIYDPVLSQGGVLQSESFLVEYDRPDTGNLIGVMLERRKGSAEVNDVPINTGANPNNNPNGISVDNTNRTDISFQKTSFVLGKSWDPFGFKVEAGFVNGDLGVVKNGQGVRWNAYGIASELYFPRPQSKWDWRMHFGFATGDNPDTVDYESFHFDRNYNVAFLLFNHRLGSYDALRTGLIRDQYDPGGTTGSATHVRKGLATSLDDEAISNTFYISPRVKYIWNDKLDLVNTITYANLVANPLSGVAFNKSLGFEWDIEFVYKPRERVQWVNQIGLLFPGGAFKNDAVPGSNNSFTYGFSSKAAISF